MSSDATPSFALLDVQGPVIVTYVYQLVDGEVSDDRPWFEKYPHHQSLTMLPRSRWTRSSTGNRTRHGVSMPLLRQMRPGKAPDHVATWTRTREPRRGGRERRKSPGTRRISKLRRRARFRCAHSIPQIAQTIPFPPHRLGRHLYGITFLVLVWSHESRVADGTGSTMGARPRQWQSA